MHWPVPVSKLRSLIPATLEVDTFEGQAWIGVVPFRMSDVYPLGAFAVPGLSAFAELNVRTYVIRDGKPGVWFFSLDAANPVAVQIARSWFKLPYFYAEMACRRMWAHDFFEIAYASRRLHRGAGVAEFEARYGPIGPVFMAQPGTLEYFLTARYCLYTMDGQGAVLRGEIDHAPWPLQVAQAQVTRNTMTRWLGIDLDSMPLLHYADRLDVVVWPLRKVEG